MNQEEKTIKHIKFWEDKRDYYQTHHYTIDADRCQKHIGHLRNELP